MVEFLFSYGTLQFEKVQKETYGRVLEGTKDTLRGYLIHNLEIKDLDVVGKSGKSIHPIAIKTGNPDDAISGVLFQITEKELIATDDYEVQDYRRVMETFESGKKAWVYIGGDQ